MIFISIKIIIIGTYTFVQSFKLNKSTFSHISLGFGIHVIFSFFFYSMAPEKKSTSFILFFLPSYCQTDILMIKNKFKISIYFK